MLVLYYGPITSKGKPNTGGFEAANRKNIDKLRELGVEVREYPNPVIKRKLGKLGKLAYLKLYATPFVLLRYVGRKDVIVHTTPLYGNLLLPSLFLLRLAKILGIPVLVDVRAGSLIHYYQTKGKSKQRQLRSMLCLAKAITVEGSSYIKDIKTVMGIAKEAVYFPNVAICREKVIEKRPEHTINVFYFGRITTNKGIDVLLEMIEALGEHYHLYLAGPIAKDVSAVSLKQPQITYLGLFTPEQLEKEMQRMHFFVFPTKHIGEGQSNSLIEAMANGLVPIVSNQGFNAEVVSDCGVVLEQGKTGRDYAAVIKSIDVGTWEKLSKKCKEHIHQCHNIDKEIPKLINIYQQMIVR